MCVGVAISRTWRQKVKRKAFIVEDAPEVVATLRALLADEDFEVLASAATEQDASEWLQQNQGNCDVVTLDLLLAEGSGFGVLRQYAMSPQRGKVVVFSGFITDSVRERCVAFGADAVFSKTESAQLALYLRGVAQREEPEAPS
ncbi:response regulator [Ramlibacter sp.]|uniref:response regulator n=1 Tax=Ramlibacter sp. TaxID=1917967 RepID=UPI002627FC27|nr:response regulator [Ramlibacter sp.]MDB5957293.1 response regulator receiver protein [Ramlibacter sp.]